MESQSSWKCKEHSYGKPGTNELVCSTCALLVAQRKVTSELLILNSKIQYLLEMGELAYQEKE